MFYFFSTILYLGQIDRVKHVEDDAVINRQPEYATGYAEVAIPAGHSVNKREYFFFQLILFIL